MAIRLNSREILVNILWSENARPGMVLSRAQFLGFQVRLDDIVPGHIFYETEEDDTAEALECLGAYCWSDKDGNIHFLSAVGKGDRYEACNAFLPEVLGRILPNFADDFVATELSLH